jgi:hypothetical protein
MYTYSVSIRLNSGQKKKKAEDKISLLWTLKLVEGEYKDSGFL